MFWKSYFMSLSNTSLINEYKGGICRSQVSFPRSHLYFKYAQLAGVIEYTDCISAER